MKASEIPIKAGSKVQTRTSSHRFVDNQWRLNDYVEEFGDVEVVLVDGVYTVPEFAESIAKYNERAAADVKRWGAN